MIKVKLLLLLTLFISIIDAKVLFQQTSSTKCSDFQNFDRGKGDKVGGETCQPSDGVITLTKPAISERAEVRGPGRIDFENGKKYYIAWNFMLSSTVTNNAIFQWKAYGLPMLQNFPIVIKCIGNTLYVMQFQDPAFGRRENTLFYKKISPNTWYSNMLAINVSDQNQGGSVEYWFNGVQQELAEHGDNKTVWPCRTFDGTSVSPKFGIYGAFGTDVTSSFKNLLVGETLQDMNYGNGTIGYDSAATSNSYRKSKLALTLVTTTVAITLAGGII